MRPRPDARAPDPGHATLAVNAGAPYQVIAYSFQEGQQEGPTEIGPPGLFALVLVRPEDESWMRETEQDQREVFCLLDPCEPESEIGAFTFAGRVSGFRDLRGGLAVEFASVGPIMPHFLRGKRG